MDAVVSSSARRDPRAERSVTALGEAVLALASRSDPASISVTALVQAAGVSRKTFYNHASSPGELLARILTAELDRARDQAERDVPMASDDLGAAVRHRLRAILQHIADRRGIYLPVSEAAVPPELYRLLTDHFRAAVEASIIESHRVAPVVPGFDDARHRAAAVDMYASFVAHAYAGAIQSWLRHPEANEVDFLQGLILSALPPWMLIRPTP